MFLCVGIRGSDVWKCYYSVERNSGLQTHTPRRQGEMEEEEERRDGIYSHRALVFH